MTPEGRRRRRSDVDPRWALRARRARTLLADRPHTAALLQFYLSLLELQTAVCAPIDVTPWVATVETPGGGVAPQLHLERLPLGELSVALATFCREMPETAPAPVTHSAGAIAGARAETRVNLLLALLTGDDLATIAGPLGCEPAPLAFLPRAFLSPIVETISALALAGETTSGRVCPRCGWPPQVSRLVDESSTLGVRRLVCSFCAAGWIFPRSVCPACGVSGDAGLEFHVDEALPHVRVEACHSCRRYLKSVDLRVLGLAEPLVDDLATPELDLWATGQGLDKIAPNLLGL